MKTEIKILASILCIVAVASFGLLAEESDAEDSWWSTVTIEELKEKPGLYSVDYEDKDGNIKKINYRTSAVATLDLDGWIDKVPKSLQVTIVDNEEFSAYAMNATFSESSTNLEKIYKYQDPKTKTTTFYVTASLSGSFTNASDTLITINEENIYVTVNAFDWSKHITVGKLTYNGKVQTAPISISDNKGVSYEFTATNNKKTNAGEYVSKVVLDGKLGELFGSKNVNWSIAPKSLEDESIEGTLSMADNTLVLTIKDTARNVVLTEGKDADYIATYNYPGEDEADKKYSATATGKNNYKDSRLFTYVVTYFGGTLHVNDIYTDGSISRDVFEGMIFVFPDNGGYGKPMPSSAYYITVKDGWGQLVFTDNPEEIEAATEAGVTQTLKTASEWNYIEINGIEDNGYYGHVEGTFNAVFSSSVTPTPAVVYEIGSTFSEDGIVYTVTSLDNKTVSVTGYESGIKAAVAIPGDVEGFKVTKIGTKAFYGCKTITSIDLGENIVSVGVKAFANCTKLDMIVFNDGLKTISAYAFYNCAKLTAIDLPDTVKTIGSYAFYKCNALKSVSFDSALKTVGKNPFSVSFQDAEGKAVKMTAKNLAGKTFEGSDKVLKLVA